jgi:hypothetical protein
MDVDMNNSLTILFTASSHLRTAPRLCVFCPGAFETVHVGLHPSAASHKANCAVQQESSNIQQQLLIFCHAHSAASHVLLPIPQETMSQCNE